KLYGFDSFEGLSEPTEDDNVQTDYTVKWKKNDLAVNESIALRNLERFSERVVFFKGCIPERLNEVDGIQFRLVNIDVDLYEPSRDAVEFFDPRLSTGGVIVCDDYGSELCPGAKCAMDEAAARFGTTVVHLTTGQGLIFKL